MSKLSRCSACLHRCLCTGTGTAAQVMPPAAATPAAGASRGAPAARRACMHPQARSDGRKLAEQRPLFLAMSSNILLIIPGCAPRRYALEPDTLRLGLLPYAQGTDAEVLLVNAGAMPFDFTAAVEPEQEQELQGAAVCGEFAVSPARGHVAAFGRAPLRVRVSTMSYAPTPDPHYHG